MRNRKSAFPPKGITKRPPKSVRPAGNPALDFAVQFDMITPEERQAVLEGRLEIRQYALLNAKAGNVLAELYPNRRVDLDVDQILGLNDETD